MAESKEIAKIKEKQGLKEEFIEFINRGSMIDLAVGVAVGGAFTAIVNSLVNDIVMPIVGLLLGGVDFTGLAIRIPNFFGTGDEAVIAYGNFIQNVRNRITKDTPEYLPNFDELFMPGYKEYSESDIQQKSQENFKFLVDWNTFDSKNDKSGIKK